MIVASLSIIAGILLLSLGGDRLVRYSGQLGVLLRLSPMVVGLTIVAFATSGPELATALTASWRGAGGIVFGNVVGSNIANLSLILGLAAALRTIHIHARFLRREIPFVIGVGVLLIPVTLGKVLDRRMAAGLLALLVPYLWVLLRQHRETVTIEAEFKQALGEGKVSALWVSLGVLASSIILLVGAHVLVDGSVAIARAFDISERVIGLSLVAVGTSLPELASCLAASIKGEGDIVLGNLIGSNIFNILCVLGAAGLVHPVQIPAEGAVFDLTVMIAASLLLLGFVFRDHCLRRWEGLLLVFGYVVYITAIYLA